MDRLSKYLSLCLLVILATSSMIMVSSTTAQSVPTPSVPEFTLKITDIMVGGGLETEIINQPIIPNGHDSAWIYYDFRYKWHESTNWYHHEPDPTKWERQYLSQVGTTGVTRRIGSPNSYYEILGSSTSHQLDVQIRAINGYAKEGIPYAPPIGVEPGDNPVIVVNTSEWSETVTIILPDYKPETATTTPRATINPTPMSSTEPSPTFTQTTSPVPSNDFVVAITIAFSIVFAVLIIIVLFLVLIYKRIQRGS